MLNVAVLLAMVLLGVALLLNTWRLYRGPDATDRILALDIGTAENDPGIRLRRMQGHCNLGAAMQAGAAAIDRVLQRLLTESRRNAGRTAAKFCTVRDSHFSYSVVFFLPPRSVPETWRSGASAPK